jgi:hypothetical protein
LKSRKINITLLIVVPSISLNRWKKPTNARGCCKQFIVLIKSRTCFGIQIPSSGGYLFLF